MQISKTDFDNFERRYRANFFNTLSGLKSANLLGTINSKHKTNLAVFNSVIHLGANPPLMGFILRPTTVERHTYENIKSQGYYTINHINENIIDAAHQTSAKYEVAISEFNQVDLSPEFSSDFSAPFVKESLIKNGLTYKTDYLIKENDTRLVVGEVNQVHLPESIIADDGSILWEKAGTVGISGLDSYLSCKTVKKLPYAKP